MRPGYQGEWQSWAGQAFVTPMDPMCDGKSLEGFQFGVMKLISSKKKASCCVGLGL